MQIIINLLFIFLILVLQGLLGWASLPLIITILLALKKDKLQLIVYSFLIGFLQDVFLAAGFVHTLTLTLTGALAGYLTEIFSWEPDQLSILLAVILTPVAHGLNSLIGLLFYGHKFQPDVFFMNLLWATLLNLVLAPLFYLVYRRFIRNE